MEWAKKYWKVALTGGAVALLLVIVAPVFGSTHVNADHLRMVDGYEAFFYGDDDPSGATDEQFLVVGNNTCEFTTSGGPLVSVTSNNTVGNVKDPGIFDHGMGVKSKGANGAPCSETSNPEILKITAADGQKWIQLRLDTQPKQDAWVIVKLYDGGSLVGTHELLTGGAIAEYNATNGASPDEFLKDSTLPYEATTGAYQAGQNAGNDNLFIEACANPSDSGPDSGINDNCIWHIVSSLPFTRVEITTLPDWGSVALEGGDDFVTDGWDATAHNMDGDSWDTLFYRALSLTDDFYSVDEDQLGGLVVAAPGVLFNDSLPPGVVAVAPDNTCSDAGPTNGSLSLDPSDGSFTYTPYTDFNGTDTFCYEVTAGSETATATVYITVNPANDPPTGDPGPLPPVDEDDPATGYLAEDLASDIDVGDELTIISIEADNGTATPGGDGSSFTYQPNADFCGTDTITFTVYDLDGASTGEQTITIEVYCVNDAPIGTADEYDVYERNPDDSPGTLSVDSPGVLGNDTDVDEPGDQDEFGNPVDDGFLSVASHTQPVQTNPELDLTTNAEFGIVGHSLTVDETKDPLTRGSFSYTPAVLPEFDPDPEEIGHPDNPVNSWEEIGAFSYEVTWTYFVTDGTAAPVGPVTVTLTVYRVICSNETVLDSEVPGVTGAFTLLQSSGEPKCKPYSVFAHGAENAVDFVPEADGPPVELFRGLLSFVPESETEGGSQYTLSLVYDPFFDPDPSYVVVFIDLPQCVDPVYELGSIIGFPGVPGTEEDPFQTMLVVNADFDALPLIAGTAERHTWCWAGDISIPDGNGGVISIRQVIGLEDPRFGGSGFG